MGNKRFIYGVLLTLVCLIVPIYGETSGFKEIKTQKHLGDVLHTYRHEASGLEVIWIENDDVNKAFMIGVKTPTIDDTGVNHILEHTLFTGSDQYPSASLFFDACEAYPSTYMNALTSGDMTIFPFSTPYLPCYEKLLSIYLDAIFKPNLLDEPYGFYEEGFHYVPEEERVGGVVYNEMKGAYANLERTVYREIRNMVYDQTHYAFDSGGMPDAIPSLTYEHFLETYENYYYPGNMKMILYGSIPIKESLEEILSYVIDTDEPKESVDLGVNHLGEQTYKEVAALPNTDRACIVKSFVMDDPLTACDIQDLDLWMTTYLMSPQSYFQYQLLQQGVHVKWLKDDDVPYPIYSVVLTDIPLDKVKGYERFLDYIIQNAPKHLYTNVFLEQDVLKEAKWIWEKQESSNNRGINIGQSILDSWAHNKENNQYYLKYEQVTDLSHLNKDVQSLLFDKASRYTLVLLPSEQEFKNPVTLTPLSEGDWTEIYDQMKGWQDRQHVLEPIELEQLVTGIDTIPDLTRNEDCWEMETHIDTNLSKSQLYVNTSHIEADDLPYLFLYSYLLQESAKDITPFSGVIETQITAYPLSEGFWPCFKLSCTTENKETDHATLFTQARGYLVNRPKGWYRQKLIEYVMGVKSDAQNNALSILASLCLNAEDPRGAYLYQQGYPQYVFCKALLDGKDDQWIEGIKAIDERLYHKNGIVLSTVTPTQSKNKVADSWHQLIEVLPTIPNLPASYQFVLPQGDCWVQGNMSVDYSFRGLVKEKGIEGMDYLYASYLTKQYLNPQIRVKLGAYGAGCQVYDLRSLGIYTYRDPDYRLSSEVVEQSAEFLSRSIDEAQLNCSKAEAISRIHRQFKLLGSGLEQINMVEHLILSGKSPSEIVKYQQEVLDATPEALMNRAKAYQRLFDLGKVGVMSKKDYNKEQNFTLYCY